MLTAAAGQAEVEPRDAEWIEVRTEPSEQGRQAALRLQAAIERALSRDCGCDCPEA
ncbi:hypothetical protein SAMN02745121_00911 [Nannocystis exedens]|uniref:Uncharacterized protein n=1 Tax=Nannocystis exedens TaxID=54 RepID=A0A1I1UAF1_9BACT|nr:hypothetical protein NAEX_04446 [Nannocystis exedens]SFD64910.1 hypothetical protein SAMN02745121_00911 [Nannocystis exedens]